MSASLREFASGTAAVASAATAATTVATLLLGQQRDQSAWAPLNAVSHIAFGDEAAEHTELSAKYTGTGAAINGAAMMSWAAVYTVGMRSLRRPSLSTAVAAGAVVSALAYVTDYYVVPKRLTPGFEKRLAPRSLFVIYATLAAGLAAGWAMQSRAQSS